MLSTPTKKTKIVLADYPYRRDIEYRLILSDLSAFEIKVLQEILHHTLEIKISELIEALDVSNDELLAALAKLEPTKLFKMRQSTLHVDKEVRKYLEFQIEKFDEDFKPDLEFLQSMLNQVPIHILPVWYAIPRSSDNIFASIIEKYLLTPQIYRTFLEEVEFDHPVIMKMIKDINQAPHFKVPSRDFIQKYKLTREQFEEYIVLLEYHFIACLSYERVKERWEEIVTPFAEWREYLEFERGAEPIAIEGPIDRQKKEEFAFIQDMALVLNECRQKKIEKDSIGKLLRAEKLEQVVGKLIQVGYAKQNERSQLLATEKGRAWLEKSLPAQATELAINPLNTLSSLTDFGELWTNRNLRMIEKSLRRLIPQQWVEFDQFFSGFSAPLGEKEPIVLTKRGKKWKYRVPTYSEHEKQFVFKVF